MIPIKPYLESALYSVLHHSDELILTQMTVAVTIKQLEYNMRHVTTQALARYSFGSA